MTRLMISQYHILLIVYPFDNIELAMGKIDKPKGRAQLKSLKKIGFALTVQIKRFI
jgi:hypothetical protein